MALIQSIKIKGSGTKTYHRLVHVAVKPDGFGYAELASYDDKATREADESDCINTTFNFDSTGAKTTDSFTVAYDALKNGKATGAIGGHDISEAFKGATDELTATTAPAA